MTETRDLSELLAALDIQSEALDVPVRGLTADSRAVRKGDVFLAMSGFQVHGIDYAYQAERSGAAAILAESVKPGRALPKGRQMKRSIPVIEVPELGDRLGELAADFYQHPSRDVQVIGVTGTNGKTSTAWLLCQALEALRMPCAYIGTLGAGRVKTIEKLNNTTPSAIEIQRLLADFRDQGVRCVCLEVSSHALDQRRVGGIHFNAVVLTNLTRDHLDYHGSMEAYAASKKKLFLECPHAHAVLNLDDALGREVHAQLAAAGTAVSGYSRAGAVGADVRAEDLHLHAEGMAFRLHEGGDSVDAQIPLMGAFNVENCLAVVAVLRSNGWPLPSIAAVLPRLRPVPGRINPIETPDDRAAVVIDYAHTPDALQQVLKALREHVPAGGRLWCVFGCGGNRDKGKRPLMGALAEQLADRVIITDDNPRFEHGDDIVSDIVSGMHGRPEVIRDREAAIRHAIELAGSKDLVLIAGKGHEKIQEIKGQLLPFNDRKVAARVLEECA